MSDYETPEQAAARQAYNNGEPDDVRSSPAHRTQQLLHDTLRQGWQTHPPEGHQPSDWRGGHVPGPT